MKTQMRVQKILMLVSLIIAALTFVYALYFMTGSMGNVTYYIDSIGTAKQVDNINGLNFHNAAQSYVSAAVVLSIIFICIAVCLFIAASNKRRNYYITNYIVNIVFVVFALVLAIYTIVGISGVMNLFFNDIAWEAGTNGGLNVADKFQTAYPLYKDSANFVLGYILSVIVILDAVAVALCTVWKYFLMKGEKELLKNNTVKEVA
jgi:hypothetical protein